VPAGTIRARSRTNDKPSTHTSPTHLGSAGVGPKIRNAALGPRLLPGIASGRSQGRHRDGELVEGPSLECLPALVEHGHDNFIGHPSVVVKVLQCNAEKKCLRCLLGNCSLHARRQPVCVQVACMACSASSNTPCTMHASPACWVALNHVSVSQTNHGGGSGRVRMCCSPGCSQSVAGPKQLWGRRTSVSKGSH
jgi:hypothetical protein